LILTFTSDICKILLAIFLPPLGVFLERGCNADFLINILLTVLGYIPVSSGTYFITHDRLTNNMPRVSSMLCTLYSSFSGDAQTAFTMPQ
jgi:uncharacterized membrane protein YqaE (UPF0057 family)